MNNFAAIVHWIFAPWPSGKRKKQKQKTKRIHNNFKEYILEREFFGRKTNMISFPSAINSIPIHSSLLGAFAPIKLLRSSIRVNHPSILCSGRNPMLRSKKKKGKISAVHLDSLDFSGTSSWGGRRFKKLPWTGWLVATADSSSVNTNEQSTIRINAFEAKW